MNATIFHTTVTEMRPVPTQQEVMFAHANQVSQAMEKLVRVSRHQS